MSAPYECKQRTVFEEGKSGNVLWHVGMGKYWFFLDPKTKGIGSIVDVGHRVASRDAATVPSGSATAAGVPTGASGSGGPAGHGGTGGPSGSRSGEGSDGGSAGAGPSVCGRRFGQLGLAVQECGIDRRMNHGAAREPCSSPAASCLPPPAAYQKKKKATGESSTTNRPASSPSCTVQRSSLDPAQLAKSYSAAPPAKSSVLTYPAHTRPNRIPSRIPRLGSPIARTHASHRRAPLPPGGGQNGHAPLKLNPICAPEVYPEAQLTLPRRS